MIFHVLDALLGTTTKVRILRALAPLTSPVSGNEAQKLARVRSAASMWSALDELSSLGILNREETRGSHLFRFNRGHDLAGSLTALFEAESRRLGTLRDELRRILDGAQVMESVRSVIVFGSNARGEAGPKSDLDLLVVTDSEPTVVPVRDALLKESPRIRDQFGLGISPYVLSRERVETRYREGDPLIEAIEAEGRTLLGSPFPEVVNAW